MTHYLLRILRELDGIYEHKLAVRLGKEYLKFPELNQLILDGFAERFIKKEDFAVKGIRLTNAGKVELARLDAIPPTPFVPDPKQLRFQELKSKLSDNSITFEETKDLLKMFFRL